jgi:putative MATE family efflux protein
MEKENKMAVLPMPKLVVTMSIPLMLSLLIQSLYNIVDGIFVAMLSEDALTATSLAYPMQMLMIAVGVGTGVGVNAVLSKNIGAGNREKVENTAMTGVGLSIISTLVFVIIGFFAVIPFICAFTENDKIAEYGISYLSICMVFCFGSLVSTMFQRFMQAAGDTFYSMVSLIAGAVTNLILDPVLIFGFAGLPALGVRGAAIATVIGQWVSAVAAIWLNTVKNPAVPVRLRGFHMDGKTVAEIYKVGFPTIITQSVGSIMIASVNAILMPFSSTAVAFFGAYYKLQNFLFMPMNGLGQAAIPIVGFSYGAKNNERIKSAIRTVVKMAACIALLATILFMSVPQVLLGLFSPSDEMLRLGIPALRIIAFTFIPASITMVLGYSMSGLGNGLVNMIGTGLRQLVIFIPLVYVFAGSFGVEKCWYAIWISETVAFTYSITATLRVLKNKKIFGNMDAL